MTFSGHTDVVRQSAQKSSRNGTRVESIIIHHAATTDAAGVVGMMVSGSRTVSSNYVVGRDGTVYGVVPEEDRAWTSGSASDGGRGAAWDRKSITFETANQSAGGSWPISDASYESVSDVIADVATRYGFDVNRNTVVGHRELWSRYRASYATACPGGFDLDRLVNMARAKMGKGAAPAYSGGTGAGNGGGAYSEVASVKEYQQLLIAKGYSVGATGADGIKGPATTAAVVAFQRASGLTPDGLVGPMTIGALRSGVHGTAPAPAPAAAAPPFPLPAGSYFGPRSGPAASVSGYFSHREDLRRWQAQMKARGWAINPDGLYGGETASVAAAFQSEKGLARDSLVGPATWAAAWTAPVT